MVRDESFNIRANLPLWGSSFFDAYVFAVDERTVDDTWKALDESIPAGAPRFIFNYTFDGFGPARTLVFEKAWEHFPNITHVLVADPDWRPDMKTINKSDLNNAEDDVYVVSASSGQSNALHRRTSCTYFAFCHVFQAGCLPHPHLSPSPLFSSRSGTAGA
jgi:hypothetical protein